MHDFYPSKAQCQKAPNTGEKRTSPGPSSFPLARLWCNRLLFQICSLTFQNKTLLANLYRMFNYQRVDTTQPDRCLQHLAEIGKIYTWTLQLLPTPVRLARLPVRPSPRLRTFRNDPHPDIRLFNYPMRNLRLYIAEPRVTQHQTTKLTMNLFVSVATGFGSGVG